MAFLDRAFGSGLLTGSANILLWMSYIVMLSLYSYAFGSYGASLFPQDSQLVWKHILITFSIVGITGLNLLNARLIGEAEDWIVLVKLTILVLFIAVGIWSINGTGKEQRWIVIHNLADGKKTGIYHIEVIQKATGAPSWQIERLVKHMAITEAALKRSVVKPLNSGAVYPEAFDDARAEWQAQNGGKGGEVCSTSVIDCMAK